MAWIDALVAVIVTVGALFCVYVAHRAEIDAVRDRRLPDDPWIFAVIEISYLAPNAVLRASARS
jgi:hypothetical protein